LVCILIDKQHRTGCGIKNRKFIWRNCYMRKEVIVERNVVVPEESTSATASNAIWAVALVIIVAMIVGVVYYSGILKRVPVGGPQKIDVKVSAPPASQ